MYYVSKRLEIAGAHKLKLNYESKCSNIHGHNWIVTIHCKSEELDANGMVIDFTHIKKMVHDKFDHKFLNEIVNFNPTAENIARYICDTVPKCYKVEVQESEGNIAVYEKDEDDEPTITLVRLNKDDLMEILEDKEKGSES